MVRELHDPQSLGSKEWSCDLRDSELRMTVLAETSSNLPDQHLAMSRENVVCFQNLLNVLLHN
jgi:hypothetical protein